MRDRLLRKLIRERFVVTLKSGQAFDGLLDEHDGSHMSFVDARSLSEGSQPVPLQGVLFVDRANVAYMQRPMPPGAA